MEEEGRLAPELLPHWEAARRWRRGYEEALRMVGEEGLAIYRIWRAVAEQRNMGGALEHLALWKYLEEARIPRGRRFEVFEKVLFIDDTYRELARRQSPPPGE